MQYKKTKVEAAKCEWSSELSSQSQQNVEFDIDEPDDSEVIESTAASPGSGVETKNMLKCIFCTNLK